VAKIIYIKKVKMKYMIYLIGANATGKSSMTGWILNNFKNS